MGQLSLYQNIMEQLNRQLHNFFIDVDLAAIEGKVAEAYERCITALTASKNKYLNPDEIPHFYLEHSGCWSMFLYYLSNSLKNVCGADKIYYLNKILHGVEWFYEVELPEHFMVEHPIGSVLGRADYGDYLFFYQGVTVGGNISLSSGEVTYPTLGDKVVLFSNAKVLGSSHVGNNVILSANSFVKDENIPDFSIVFGNTPNLIIKQDEEKIKRYMRELWR